MGKKKLQEYVDDVLSNATNLQKGYVHYELPNNAGDATVPTLDAWSPNEIIAKLQKENEELKAIVKSYEQDGEYAQFFSMNRKANETAASLNAFTLSLKSDDKTFERYVALVKIMPEQTRALDTLKREYLKIDDEKLEEIETTGIPLIERRDSKLKQSKKAR